MSRELGPQDDCVQCGQSKGAIKESQRRGDPIYCVGVDYFGECDWEADRHRFIWTAKDVAAEEAEDAYWERAGEALDRMELSQEGTP